MADAPSRPTARLSFRRLAAWMRVHAGITRDELLALTPGECADIVREVRQRERALDRRAGRICATLANIHRDPARKHVPFSEYDFVPRPVQDEEADASAPASLHDEFSGRAGDAFFRWAESRIRRQNRAGN